MSREIQCTNAYYYHTLAKIGGIESHFYYLSRKYYRDKGLVILYEKCENSDQLLRINKYGKAIKVNPGDTIRCKHLWVCFQLQIFDHCNVYTDRVSCVIHGDYQDQVMRNQLTKKFLPLDSRIDDYYGVSQLVCDSWFKLTGLPITNLYQPVILDPSDKQLMFISAMRLSEEKGPDVVKKLTAIFDDNLNYTWIIYTNLKSIFDYGRLDQEFDLMFSNNVIFRDSRMDIVDKLSAFDAYISTSYNEGFGLSVVEALTRGIPVIGIDIPVFRELGLNSSNSVLFNESLSNIDINEIKNIRSKQFTYNPPNDLWGQYLEDKDRRIEINRLISKTGEIRKDCNFYMKFNTDFYQFIFDQNYKDYLEKIRTKYADIEGMEEQWDNYRIHVWAVSGRKRIAPQDFFVINEIDKAEKKVEEDLKKEVKGEENERKETVNRSVNQNNKFNKNQHYKANYNKR